MLLMPCAIQAEDVYDQVKADIRAERNENAIKTLRSMVKNRPDDFHAWFLFGVASAHLNQYHQAIEAFRHVIQLNPKLAEPHDNLAVIYNELDDVPAAVRELELSLIKRPDYPIAEENLADLYVKLAIKRYRSALEREPNPELEKRYLRLLQVRDPDVASNQKRNRAITTMPMVRGQDRQDDANHLDEGEHLKQPESVDSEVVVSEAAGEEEVVMTPPVQPDRAAEQSLENGVLDALEAWRMAWSSQSITDYFAAYAEGFQVPDRFNSVHEWQLYKRRVIGSKSYIDVEISDIHVEFEQGGKLAHVKFFQKFRSNSYNGDSSKVLVMRLDNGTWKILREDSVS